MNQITANILIIGNEILSGRTQDSNINFLANQLASLGIIVSEVRVIPDEEATIIKHVLELKSKCNYLFTTGGIGPTHDDITSESIAKAFSKKLILHPLAEQLIRKHYEKLGASYERLQAGLKMAHVPETALLINNPISSAPGFYIENVYVMAGIPNIMQAMFLGIKNDLQGGAIIESRTITVMLGESIIAKDFHLLQQQFNKVEMGSYPFTREGKWGTSLVLRSSDIEQLQLASNEVNKMVIKYGGEVIE